MWIGILSAVSILIMVGGLHQIVTFRSRKLDSVIYHDDTFRGRSYAPLDQAGFGFRKMVQHMQGFSFLLLNEKRRTALEKQLDQAASHKTPEVLIAEQLTGGLLGAVFGSIGFLVGVMGLLTLLFFGFAGWMQPRLALQRAGRRRSREIGRSFLPFIDLLALLLETGASLYTGLEKAGVAVGGVFGEEIAVTLKQSHSRGLSDALFQWSDRAATSDINGLVTLLNQAGKYGAGMDLVYTLRQFSFAIRSNKQNQIDRDVQKMGIKILFPMFFLILMPMMAVLFAPVLMSLGESGLL